MGVIGLTRALATEVADHNIKVNALAPGITDTATVRKDAGDYLNSLLQLQAIHSPGEPKDMANVVSFLTSDDGAFMTGQTPYQCGMKRLPIQSSVKNLYFDSA